MKPKYEVAHNPKWCDLTQIKLTGVNVAVAEFYGNTKSSQDEIRSILVSHADLLVLAEKVANLNPDVAEIGAGMLKQLVASARAAIAQK